VRFQRVVNELPADFKAMRREARTEGHQFLDRLASDWVSGAMRFERPGEALLAAYSEGVLAAIGGITIDPIVPDALRIWRFYVRPAFRRTGIGGEVALALLEGALQRVRVVTLKAARGTAGVQRFRQQRAVQRLSGRIQPDPGPGRIPDCCA
jgi:GNAT superfamily N-acetyltransferase